MEQALHSMEIEPAQTVEIIVHISEDLGEQQRGELITALKDNGGITAAEFCPLRYHLMLVSYDKGMYTSRDVLDRVSAQNVSARLIGPV